MSATLQEISKSLGLNDNGAKKDKHTYGRVVAVYEDHYDVKIAGSDETTRCARLVGCVQNDTVIVTIMENGYATVTSRLGGDKDAVDAKAGAKAAADFARSAQTSANTASDAALAAQAEVTKAVTAGNEAQIAADKANTQANAAELAASKANTQAAAAETAATAANTQANAAELAASKANQAATDANNSLQSVIDSATEAEKQATEAERQAGLSALSAAEAKKGLESVNSSVNDITVAAAITQAATELLKGQMNDQGNYFYHDGEGAHVVSALYVEVTANNTTSPAVEDPLVYTDLEIDRSILNQKMGINSKVTKTAEAVYSSQNGSWSVFVETEGSTSVTETLTDLTSYGIQYAEITRITETTDANGNIVKTENTYRPTPSDKDTITLTYDATKKRYRVDMKGEGITFIDISDPNVGQTGAQKILATYTGTGISFNKDIDYTVGNENSYMKYSENALTLKGSNIYFTNSDTQKSDALLTNYMAFSNNTDGSPVLTLGQRDEDNKLISNFSTVISNTEIAFMVGETKQAYITATGMQIATAVITEDLQMGTTYDSTTGNRTSGFSWSSRQVTGSSGKNLYLKWLG